METDEEVGGQKVSQEAAKYRTAVDGEPSCAGCDNFFEPTQCRLVQGPVSAAGICDLYAPKRNEANVMAQVFGNNGGPPIG